MNIQANLARTADNEGQLSRKHQFQEIALCVPDDLPIVDLVELYTGIENVLESERCPMLQLVGAGADCAPIAMDLAWTGASVMGKRILLLNCASSGRHLLAMSGAETRGADPAAGHAVVADSMVKVTGQEIYMVDIVGNPKEANAGHAVELVSSYFDAYCAFLDMVIVVPPPAELDPLGTIMAHHVDGNILVVEADCTRRAEAVRLREVLIRSGRPLVGAILNNRHNHLPLWLSRRL
jgi:Mrp family chromosome partitioning ATPase